MNNLKFYFIIIFILTIQLFYGNKYINNIYGFSFNIPDNIVFNYKRGEITKEFTNILNKKYIINFYKINIKDGYTLFDTNMTEDKILEYYKNDEADKIGERKPYYFIIYRNKRIGLYSLGPLYGEISGMNATDIYNCGLCIIRYNYSISVNIWYFDMKFEIPIKYINIYEKSNNKSIPGVFYPYYFKDGQKGESELRQKIINKDKDAPEELVKLFSYIESIAKSLEFWDVTYLVKNNNDYLYVENNTKSKYVRKLNKGEKLILDERILKDAENKDNPTWIKVKTEKGETGWCIEENLDLQIDKEHINYYESKVDGLRLRQKPLIDSNIIRNLQKGERVIYIDDSNREETVNNVKGIWLKVKTEKGEIGWCFNTYLQEVKDTTSDGN
jgi:uncharacterized protein YgiM (DUF1202 family)